MPLKDPTPVPLCKIARENGGTVPIACLFTCERNCVGAERDVRDHAGHTVKPLDAVEDPDA